MLKYWLLLSISLIACFHCLAQTNIFQTSHGQTINIRNDGIYVNGKNLHQLDSGGDIYIDKQNRLIENGGSVFLFVPVNGAPNKERLHGFKITNDKVDAVVDAISSDIRDWDGDTFLEFGGRNITEVYPGKDSMYYIPSYYYEIRNGKIQYDSILTKNMDIRENGIYLHDQLDSNGNCCKVIPKPAKLVNPIIISERIDGPANVRDAIGGKLLFVLDDNAPVTTAEEANKWYEIGLVLELSPAQYKSSLIEKGSTLYANGKTVGKAMADLQLEDVFDYNNKLRGTLTGYTSMQNIKAQTLPEKVLSGIIGQNTAGLAQLNDFIKGFQFTKTTICGYTSYFLNGGVTYGPSAPPRFELLFDNDKLFGIVHLRKLEYKYATPIKLNRGFFLTVTGNQPEGKIKDFVKQFNAMMNLAD
jgi:hypothetical protein